MDAIAELAAYTLEMDVTKAPESALAATEKFIFDTVGVGIGGSSGPLATELADTLAEDPNGAHVWSLGKRLRPEAAAQCNAYQAHNSEFDAVHEKAVAHVFSAVVPAAIVQSELNNKINGLTIIEAVIPGVHIANLLGVSARSGLRFFRPATVGAFAATAALGKLRGFDTDRLINAFSIAYSQLCGTMQAHEEGSMLLAMQMGFNTRNAVIACDLAAAGFTGPKEILQGRFGYFTLFEPGGEPSPALDALASSWTVEEVAHKPFPSGRATHGIVDGCLELKAKHGITPERIVKVTATVPPLVQQLVGRPPRTDMDINYARLCAPYVAACALINDTIRFEDFSEVAYRNARTQTLARKIDTVVRDDGDPNALTPVAVTIMLDDGVSHEIHLEHVYGAPGKPMTRAAQIEKFRGNCARAANPLAEAQADELIERLWRLRDEEHVGALVPLMVGR